MNDHRPEVADVFRTYEKDFFAKWGHVLSPQQRKAFEAIRDCRTAALGGHVEYVEQCDTCGHLVNAYNSCRNRHCPKCQAMARAKWLTARETELLPVPYFRVVFTLPQQLGALALQNAREIYSILFRAAAETLLTIAADPKRLGAAAGFLAVLHTWGQNLHLHPHLHCVVPGGGIAPDGARWIGCRKPSFLLPTGVLGSRFRNLFLTYLREAFEGGRLQFHGEMAVLGKPPAFAALWNRMKRIKWVVHAKAPFGGPAQVLKYLARYTHRVAISNSRILSISDGKVTFLWKDYADASKVKPMTLDAVEFIRRFLLHILPAGFVRIRQFGFLANRARREKLALCRALLGAPSAPPRSALADVPDRKMDKKLCPVCRTGHMILIRLPYPIALAPGMGLNAYFAYSVVKGMGVDWHVALGAVFLSGIAFLVLTAAGIRQMIVNAIPHELYSAVAAGVGLFIALIGFRNAGIIVASQATLVSLGNLHSATTLLALFGLILTAVLLCAGFRAAILVGVVATWTLAAVTGAVDWHPQPYSIRDISSTALQLDVRGALRLGLVDIVFAFLFVDLFDNIGTLLAVGKKAGLFDKAGSVPRLNRILYSDAIATVAGSMAGTSTVVSYIESSAGVAAGGRSGVTAIVAGLLFTVAMFIAPLAGAIPASATAPALIIVGSMMMTAVAEIAWTEPEIAIPAFLTMLAIPLTYSIANGLAFGFCSYTLIKLLCGRFRDVSWMVYALTALFIARFWYLDAR